MLFGVCFLKEKETTQSKSFHVPGTSAEFGNKAKKQLPAKGIDWHLPLCDTEGTCPTNRAGRKKKRRKGAFQALNL